MLTIVRWRLMVLLLVAVIAMACQARQPGVTGQPGEKAPPAIPKAEWEQKWDNLVSEAKKEGSVTIYSSWRPDTRTALTTAFKEKYGISLEFTPFSRGAEIVAKAKAEKAAGLKVVDLFGVGSTTLLIQMKPPGLLTSMKPLLVRPDVLDPGVWLEGKIPFVDEEGLALAMSGMPTRYVVYNSGLVRDGEITSYKDLLRPQYKGKITMDDPSVSGAALGAVGHVGERLWSQAETVDFLRRLVKDQEAVLQRDQRVNMESVARGKYAIVFAPLPDHITEFRALGAPVKPAECQEDSVLTALGSSIARPLQSPHPNAATVFVNWLLTREGQSVLAKSWAIASLRTDASTEGVDPLFIPVRGKKYYMETEEFILSLGKWMELSRQVIAEARK